MEQDSEALLGRFFQHHVEFVIVGGLCGVLHGVTLVTEDVDVCCRFTPASLRRIEAAVKDLHPTHRLTANRLPLELTDELCTRLKNLYLSTDLGTIDCLGEILGVGDYEAALSASMPIEMSFGCCRMLTVEALIRAKEAVGRPRDRVAISQLRAIQEHNDHHKPGSSN